MSELQTRTIAFLVTLVILIIGGIAGYLIGGLPLLLSLEIALLVAIFLLGPILKPRPNQLITRLTALVIFGEIASILARGESWIVLLLNLGLQQMGVVKTRWWLIRMIIKLMGGGVSTPHPSPSSMIIVLIQSGAKESGFLLKQRPGIWQCLYQL